ncbi:MAG: hypothetical protein A3D94_17470 [Alphaproteobacteria bacterium RIFCSPHIGHO2_12_FULL_66_14]|nr:MAG: hypothetical protein A3D94_17470 [Alphaproteobacteria bacterium RIFCSPHIGHO2_12_FULL_66_14]
MIGLGARIVGFGRSEGGAGVVNGQAIVGRVELCDQVARLHGGADIDRALHDLARDAEAQGALDAGNDRPGEHEGLRPAAVGDFEDACRAHDRFVGGDTRRIRGERQDRKAGGADGRGAERDGDYLDRETHGGPSFRGLQCSAVKLIIDNLSLITYLR